MPSTDTDTETQAAISQGFWPELLHWVQDGLFVLGWHGDPDHLIVLFHNEGFERWLVAQSRCNPQDLTELPAAATSLLIPQVHHCRQHHVTCQWRHTTDTGIWEVILLPVISDGQVNQVQGVCRQVLGDPHYSSLVQQATDIIAIVALSGTCTYVSPSLGKILGYTLPPSGFLLEPPFLHPQDRDPVHHALHTARNQPGHQITYQCRVRHAAGHWVVLEVAVTNLTGDPHVQGLVFTCRDITVRRHAEERLRQQNSYLSSLHRTSLALLHRQDLGRLLRLILEEVTTLLSAGEGFLFLVNNGELVLQVGIGRAQTYQGFRLQPGEGLAGRVWQSGQPLVIPNYEDWEGRAIRNEPSWKKAAAAVPLLNPKGLGSHVIGVLGIAHTDPERGISPSDQEVLERFAQLASLALDNHTLYGAAQRELRQRKQTQEHLAATLRSIGDGVIVTDPAGQVQLMNGMAETLTGWKQQQSLGRPLSLVFPLVQAQTRLPTPDPVQTVLRTQRPVALRSQSLLRDPWGGQERYIAASAAPIRYDAAITGVVITFRDVTQHKLTELSLRQSEARNRAILDALPDLVFRLDRWGRYLTCKGDPQELIRPPADLLGTTISEVMAPNQAAVWLDHIQQSLDQQQMRIYEYPLTLRGEERWYEARLIPIAPDELIALVRNVTQQRQEQRQQLQQAERQRLLSSIALRIRQSLDLPAILQTTVAEVRQFGQADRVVIYRFTQAQAATAIAESVGDPWPSLLGQEISHEWFADRDNRYRRDHPRMLPTVQSRPLPPQLRQYFEQFQIQAVLSLPLFLGEHLWGLLVLHDCQGSRTWGEDIVQALHQLANQVEIALQQADLHHKLQLSNEHLERQVRVRTAQLNKQIQALQLQSQILSTVQNAVMTIHLAGHITYWNRFAETLYGLSADAAMGEFFTDVIPFTLTQGEEVLAALRHGQPWSGELVLLNDTPTAKVLLIHHTPTFSSTGSLTGAISISMDITRRQEAEHALRESETRLRTLSETTTAAIFVVQDGHFLDVNPALTHITGYSRADLLGMSFWHLGDPDQQAQMQTWVEDSQALSRRQEFAIVTQAGETKWIECTLGKVPYKGFLCDLGTAVDITHRKQMELQMQQQMQELQQLNLLKDDFLSTVSHELRTPMSNMKMSIHMLRTMLLDTEKQGMNPNHYWVQRANRYLRILQDECLREIDLINDLLDLQRLEQDSPPSPLEPLDLRETLPAIVAPFFGRMQERQQSFQITLSPDLPPLFYTDRSALIRILSELLNNACKYSPPQATITLAAACHQDHLHLTVTNTGSEIPPQEQERIFDKFYRIVANDRWKQGGTGLGLALIKKMVEQQRGTITLASHDQQTTFHIHLPCSPAPTQD